ncbi:PadR family transcriptional regulator [Microvirga sp. SRT01]|jgi:PadR family transcriptional regulator PadR|uniref:PadR family transcriptional regulator n=1 Tax=Sphingomonas longa TaxID=2778730 RepID=A0ABS2D7A3_9SPHN|nr:MULTISPECIES: PadR family transcriptional regulator [Alphaproteobacteria]MBM6576814.1 PadR family transcriptional regulator [Sphingomonas sp. BT552]MBR7709859.1 PadR family transcriptional regulator [Microvirga sp. SRT01]
MWPSDDHGTLALQAKLLQYPCMTRQSDDSRDAISKWEVQLRKGVLEFVILLSLSEREQYGFELISGIAKRAAIDVPEGTLYPLLLRLAKDGLISSRLAGGDGGAPRKYYTLTIQGRQLLRGMIPSWSKLATSVDRLLPGESA